MGSYLKLRFVDRSGSPFSPRYHQAVQNLSRALWRNYPFVQDGADQDSAIEETLRRAAAYEERHGEVEHLPSLIRRIFPQVVSSMFVRKSYYARHEENREARDLESVSTTFGSQHSSEDRVYIQQLLCSLDQKQRHIMSLLTLGHKPDEIASSLGISAESVYQIIHRVRKGLKRTL